MKILRRTHITKENCLRLQDGTHLKNKDDLLQALKEMGDEEFKLYVTKWNNEIALWIKGAFKERKLARDIKRVKTKEKTIEVLKNHLQKKDQEDDQKKKGFGFGRIRFKFVK